MFKLVGGASLGTWMGNGWRGLSLSLASLAVAVMGAGFLFLSGSEGGVADSTHVIEITEQGFNPPVCVITVNDRVRFKNLDSVVHQALVEAVGGVPPTWDTGAIQPGETTSSAWGITVDTKLNYHDPGFPALTGLIDAIQPALHPQVACTPWTPTPTPTNTPTPTPTPSPTPTPDPRSAVMPEISRGE